MTSQQRSVFADRNEVGKRIEDLLNRLNSGARETTDTLSAYATAWLDQRQIRVAPSTHETDRWYFNNYVEPYLGALSVASITPKILDAWMECLKTSGSKTGGSLSADTVRDARHLLSKMLGDAVRAGDLFVNPVARTRAPAHDVEGRRVRRAPQAWTPGELRTFLDAVESRRRGPLFTLLATTGLRRGEALALSWSDIDMTRRTATISRSLYLVRGTPHLGDPKGGRWRELALGRQTIEALERQREQQRAQAARRPSWENPHDFVFTTRTGRQVHPSTPTREFREYADQLPVRRIRLHDLRHTHAILLLRAGVSVVDVSNRLGHASPATTLEQYATALQTPGQTIAEVFDRLVAEPSRHLDGQGRLSLD